MSFTKKKPVRSRLIIVSYKSVYDSISTHNTTFKCKDEYKFRDS